MESRIASDSLSISSTRCLTTSPIEISPVSFPSATTGMCRNFPAVIRSMMLETDSSPVQVATLRVITWPTGRLRAVAPCSESARTMSRSDNMPARRSPAPRITTAPMRHAESNFAAAARSAVGSIETMSPPKFRCLAARIVFTFMAASLCMQDRFSKRDHAQNAQYPKGTP
jgi:hypothetical protein